MDLEHLITKLLGPLVREFLLIFVENLEVVIEHLLESLKVRVECLFSFIINQFSRLPQLFLSEIFESLSVPTLHSLILDIHRAVGTQVHVSIDPVVLC